MSAAGGLPLARSWPARLSLQFQNRNGRSVLAGRSHDGPLVVQKPLYPEGGEVCHTIVVHPPGGIAGGDELDLSLDALRGAHALLTTPGAAKWYRSAGPWAHQRITFDLKGGAALEWLPQPTIVFDGAMAHMEFTLDLEPGARYIGWDILCFGRKGSGERFSRGRCRLSTEVRCAGRLLWVERGEIGGGAPLLESAVGLHGQTVCATMIAAAPELDPNVLAAARKAADGAIALTFLPGVLVGRSLGDSSERAMQSFARLWAVLRPALIGRDAIEPRIWRT